MTLFRMILLGMVANDIINGQTQETAHKKTINVHRPLKQNNLTVRDCLFVVIVVVVVEENNRTDFSPNSWKRSSGNETTGTTTVSSVSCQLLT